MNVWIDMCLDHNIVIVGALYLDNIYILNKQFYILYKKYCQNLTVWGQT